MSVMSDFVLAMTLNELTLKLVVSEKNVSLVLVNI